MYHWSIRKAGKWVSSAAALVLVACGTTSPQPPEEAGPGGTGGSSGPTPASTSGPTPAGTRVVAFKTGSDLPVRVHGTPGGTVVSVLRGSQLEQRSIEGNVLWSRPESDRNLTLQGVRVSATTGAIYTRGNWSLNGPGYGLVQQYSAEGLAPKELGAGSDESTLSTPSGDVNGNVVWSHVWPFGRKIRYLRPDGTKWEFSFEASDSLKTRGAYDYSTQTWGLPNHPGLTFGPIAMDPSGSPVVAGTIFGKQQVGSGAAGSVGSDGMFSLLLFKLKPYGEVSWTRALQGIAAEMAAVETTASGTIVALGLVKGMGHVGHEVLSATYWKPALFAFENDGQPRWVRTDLHQPAPGRDAQVYTAGVLAVDPSGVAYVGGGHVCNGARVTAYNLDGTLRWAKDLAPRNCEGGVTITSVTLAGRKLLVTGSFKGSLDVDATAHAAAEAWTPYWLTLEP
jgi:hypothetical protein